LGELLSWWPSVGPGDSKTSSLPANGHLDIRRIDPWTSFSDGLTRF
jgi:hypothetical protein